IEAVMLLLLIATNLRCSLSSLNEAPNQKDEHGTDGSSDETRTLIFSIPTDGLSEISRHECADDPQDRRQYETLRLVFAGRDQLGDYPGYKADDDYPDNVHGFVPV